MDWTNKNVAPNKVVQLGDVARDVLLTPFGLDESKLLKALGSMFTHKVDYADFTSSSPRARAGAWKKA